MLPFTTTFSPENADRNLKSVLMAERPGIVAWLIEGALRYQAEGLDEPDEIREASAAYRQQEDVIGRWWEDVVTFDRSIAEVANVDPDSVGTVGYRQAFSAIRQSIRTYAESEGLVLPHESQIRPALESRGVVFIRRGSTTWAYGITSLAARGVLTLDLSQVAAS